jgi:hypothetical protein
VAGTAKSPCLARQAFDLPADETRHFIFTKKGENMAA